MASLQQAPLGLRQSSSSAAVRQACQTFSSRRRPNNLVVSASSSGTSNLRLPYKRLADCLVFPPERGDAKALIHFIGGAFIGAVPELTYRLFIELLSEQNFLVIATPYTATFEHALAAQDVHQKFQNCRAVLLEDGLSQAGLSSAEIKGLPAFSVGHSNGALLQLLIGCIVQTDLPKANVVIAFNNKPAADAVPYFEQLGPIVVQLNANATLPPFLGLSRGVAGDYLDSLLQAAAPIAPVYDNETLQSLRKFTEQFPSVIDQINSGISEFRPAPLENRRTISVDYNVQDTLLLKYKDDVIDESDIVEEILTSRVKLVAGNVTKVALSGNHITPCLQDMKWKVGKAYTPIDAIAQLIRNIALSDIRETVTTLSRWLEARIS